MEKKKLLLVSVSVGLFLVIVVGVSILAFSPRNYSAVDSVRADAGANLAAQSPRPVAPGEEAAPPPGAPGGDPALSAAPPPVPVITSTEASPRYPPPNENVIYINGENAENAVKVERLNDGNTRTYITIQNPPSVAAAQAPVAAAPARPDAAAAPAPTKAPAKSPAKETKTPKKTPLRSDYWVQAGSFSTKSHADKAKEFLALKGITSIVQDSKVNGKVYYRVRVGPYTTQNEANYWLALIKEIDGMEKSLIWKSGSGL